MTDLDVNSFPLSLHQRHIRSLADSAVIRDAACRILIEGELVPRRLRRVLGTIVGRHAILRTGFPDAGQAREPVQIVAAEGGYGFQTIDLTECPDSAVDWWDPNRPQGSRSGPVLRAVLVRYSRRRHLLILTLPALCADHRTLRNLFQEIAADFLAGSEAAAPEAVSYARFSAWQNALADGDAEEAGPGLPGPVAPAALLPFESASGRHAEPGYAAESVELPMSAFAVGDAVDGPEADAEALLLACWQTLLWRHVRSADIRLGWVMDGRVFPELEPVLGPCAHVWPVSVQPTETDRFADVLDRTRRAVQDARDGMAFADWSRNGSAPHPVWGFEWVPAAPTVADAVTSFTLRDIAAWSGPFHLKLECRPVAGGRLRLLLEYERSRFDPAVVRSLLDQLTTLAADAAQRPEVRIGALRTLSPEQSRRTAAVSRRPAAADADGLTAHQMFARAAAAAPDRVAVVAEGRPTSYAELDRRANRLAHRLLQLGAGPEVPVGICLDRGLDMVVAVLAVHKAGAAYVPLDPAFPRARIEAIVEDVPMPITVTEQGSAGVLPAGRSHQLWLDRDRDAVAACDDADPAVAVDPDQLAYILHTSGSSGRPKGVQVGHAALANLLTSMRHEPGITARDNLVAVTTLSFDIAALELYLPLVAGARVTVAGRRTAGDPAALGRLLADSGATVMQATPTTWRLLVGSGWTGAPELTALVGGEALPGELADRLRPLVAGLWNMYGPTETTIWSTCARLEADAEVTVGGPIADTCVHVLDDQLAETAVGLVGEVCIGGAGVARGYAGRAGLTAERFVPDPFGCTPGGRLYRTGDLARRDPRGRIYVVGRSDSQVKIRGHRIELAEVEAVLARHPQVQAAVATARPETSGGNRLDAYVLPEPGAEPRAGELRDFLRGRLPATMVPSRFAVVASFPLTANGKVDRAALPEIGAEDRGAVRGPAAANGLERAVAQIWQAVLEIDEPGRRDNFFDLGGHSVLLVQVSSLLRERLGVPVAPLTLLEHPTIASLAEYLGRTDEGTAHTAPADTEPVTGRERLLRRRMSVEES